MVKFAVEGFLWKIISSCSLVNYPIIAIHHHQYHSLNHSSMHSLPYSIPKGIPRNDLVAQKRREMARGVSRRKEISKKSTLDYKEVYDELVNKNEISIKMTVTKEDLNNL